MNPFEKIFNYQIMSRLDETGSFAVSSQERSWLKTMLRHEAAAGAFTQETLSKLERLLTDEEDFRVKDIIMEKGRGEERQVYHPMLRKLRRLIVQGKGVKISVALKHGGSHQQQAGIPCKLEYSMVKREWYLLWYGTRPHALRSTPLRSIESLEEYELSPQQSASAKARLAEVLEKRMRTAVIEVVRAYNSELSRIVSAFSCFDKTVSFDDNTGVYRLRVKHLADESEFLLLKIRFLGLRVRVVEGDYFIRRMMETTSKALMRYQADNEEE
ncbi:WYL domain-containing protein [Paenibacillus nanensis]|uniref:WYL domain-containing protein n=1 Tax=Paenibacillus nanensis TaxID=393251 RepID=A0A3A1VIU5_9BACL|nr:WYL domain-containing protein [Paenibacillus nanensis]RIX60175.1 WYL domain-containing protein [Paenibacillus nanensis]